MWIENDFFSHSLTFIIERAYEKYFTSLFMSKNLWESFKTWTFDKSLYGKLELIINPTNFIEESSDITWHF